MTNVTGLELALIPAGTALAGVVLATVGNAWLDRRKERREAAKSQERAIAELLTATADLMVGIQATRAAYYQQHPRFRHYARLSGGVLVALASTMTGAGTFSWRELLDWHTMRPALERLLAMDRELDDKQRTVALDLAAMLTPRTSRFYAAVAALTLGPDDQLAAACRDLAPKVGALLEHIAVDDKKYARARLRTTKALEKFRATVDQRKKR